MDIRVGSWGEYYQVRATLLAAVRTMGTRMAGEKVSDDYRRWLENSRRQALGLLRVRPRASGKGLVIPVRGALERQANRAGQLDLFPDPVDNQAGAELGAGFPFLNLHTLQAALEHPFRQLAEKLPEPLIRKLRAQVATGIVMGEPLPKIARRLVAAGLPKGTYPTRAARAKAVAGYESSRITIDGNLAAYQEADVVEVQVVGRATDCPTCAPRVGQVYGVEERSELPPYHPYCVHGIRAYSVMRGGRVVRVSR